MTNFFISSILKSVLRVNSFLISVGGIRHAVAAVLMPSVDVL